MKAGEGLHDISRLRPLIICMTKIQSTFWVGQYDSAASQMTGDQGRIQGPISLPLPKNLLSLPPPTPPWSRGTPLRTRIDGREGGWMIKFLVMLAPWLIENLHDIFHKLMAPDHETIFRRNGKKKTLPGFKSLHAQPWGSTINEDLINT